MEIKTLHLIGSKKLGGAENWFFRITKALTEKVYVERGVRKGSDLCWLDDGIVTHKLLFKTVWDPISKFQIRKLINRTRPHIVQTYMGRATRLTYIPKRSDIIHISRLGGYYKLRSYTHAHAWIGNTKGICDYLIKNGFPPDKVFLIYNFVDEPLVYSQEKINALKNKLGLSSDNFIILCLGRFVPVKGHTFLLKAFSILKNNTQLPLKLILLGEGPLREKLLDLCQTLSIYRDVIFPGWQKETGIFYQLCDMVVFPSLRSETFGNVILEAWSYEKPVVCTNFLGAEEFTEDEKDVLMVCCEDPQSLADKMKLLLEDGELRNYIAHNGKQKVLKKFNKKKITSEYFELYNYLIDNKR